MTKRERTKGTPPDLTETKAHIFIAGHELLKAAEGVLKFCRFYVESTSERSQHKNMLGLLSKGINIAKSLGLSLAEEPLLKGAANKVMKGFCDIIEKEIVKEKPKPKKRRVK